MDLQKIRDEMEDFLDKVGMCSHVYLNSNLIIIVTSNYDSHRKGVINDIIGLLYVNGTFHWTVLIPELSNTPLPLPMKSVCEIIKADYLWSCKSKNNRTDEGITIHILKDYQTKVTPNFDGRVNLCYKNETYKRKPFLYHWKYILMILAKNHAIYSRYFTFTSYTTNVTEAEESWRGYICGSKWTYAVKRFHIASINSIYKEGEFMPPAIIIGSGCYKNKDTYVIRSEQGNTKIVFEKGNTYTFGKLFDISYQVFGMKDDNGTFLVVRRMKKDIILEEFPLLDQCYGYITPLGDDYIPAVGMFIPSHILD